MPHSASTDQTSENTDHAARRLARLAAVQALYQIALTQESSDILIRRFHADPAVFLEEDAAVINVDKDMFGIIVAGVCSHLEDLDLMISATVDAHVSSDRMEPLLKAILRAGVFELQHRTDIQTGIIINDYVDVAHGFFDAKEPGLVNAVLDRLAKKLRS